MNRHATLLLALAFLFASCDASDDARDLISQGKCIQFLADAEGDTRALSAFPTDHTFRVYAWDTDASEWIMKDGDGGYANSNVVNFDNIQQGWYPKYKYYWPDEHTSVDFYAFCPSDIPFDKTTKSLVYTSDFPVTGHDDVLFAKTTSSKSEASAIGYAAELSFNHAMTQVKISGYKKETGWTVIVKDIALCNINSVGSYSLVTNEWTDGSSPRTYDIIMANEIELTSTNKNSPISLTGNDGPLILMPQQQKVWDGRVAVSSTAKSYLRIECSIIDGNGIHLVGTESAFGYAYVPLPVDWLAGKTYSYVLGFGAGLDENGQPLATVSISIYISNTTINSFESTGISDLEGKATGVPEWEMTVMDAFGNIISFTDSGNSVNGDSYNQDGSLPSVNGNGTITGYTDGGVSVGGDGYQNGNSPSLDGNGSITGYTDGGDGTNGESYNQDGTLPSVNGNGTITGYTDGGVSVNGDGYQNGSSPSMDSNGPITGFTNSGNSTSGGAYSSD